MLSRRGLTEAADGRKLIAMPPKVADFKAARAAVAAGRCPACGGALRRNLALAGWWQCEQNGDAARRARPADPPCPWQMFTE